MKTENNTEEPGKKQDTDLTIANNGAGNDDTDWHGRFLGQQKVNRDLEGKLDGTRKENDQLKAELAKLKGQEAEYEKAREREKIQAEAIASANRRVLKAEIRTAASGRLQDPDDALRYIDLDSIGVDENGNVDTSAIGVQLDKLLQDKPYLGKAGNIPKGIQTTPPSGTRDGDQHKGQLKREDLVRMTPEQIVKAKAEGRLDDLLGRKH